MSILSYEDYQKALVRLDELMTAANNVGETNVVINNNIELLVQAIMIYEAANFPDAMVNDEE